MRILSIETSADETAVSYVKSTGDFPDASYEILGNALHSQMKLHEQYGGIFPMMAKREHAKAILPLLQTALEEAGELDNSDFAVTDQLANEIRELLHREEDLADLLLQFVRTYTRPDIDMIAVTAGPGLAPALWVGVNFARALAKLWNIKVVPINHMEGHLLASIYDVVEDDKLAVVQFPAIGLLISGGHTELILMETWGSYKKIGQTRDDAVGEAFDKVARMMGLPYPGGPQISTKASEARKAKLPAFKDDLPLPMLHSQDLDFSFSGLKTAVRYAIENKELSETDIQALSRDFEDVVAEVLIKKTAAAIEQYGAKTLIIGGGVSANSYLRQQFQGKFIVSHPDLEVYFPDPKLSTDNSVMIALAGHARAASALSPHGAEIIQANGNQSL